MAVVKAILPSRALADFSGLRRVLRNTHRQVVEAARADFHVTTQTWTHQPQFTTNADERGGTVETTDQIYGYVSGGTQPHIIRPRRKRVLRFRIGGQAKTIPNEIMSQRGARGRQIVFARQVRHPGTQARNFDKVIKQKWDREYPAQLQRAIDAEYGTE